MDHLPEFVGHLAPNPQNKSDCVVAYTVTLVKDGVTTARALNPTDQNITLREGMHLGEFFFVDESELVSLPQAAFETDSSSTATEGPIVSLEESSASSEQEVQLSALLAEHQEIFSTSKGASGKCPLIRHHIKTEDHPPLRQRAYRTSPEKRVEIDKQVAGLLADGVIEESCSPWASPVVLVKKKNGEWRFFIDYRRLNSITVKDSHPLSKVDDTLDALAGSMWFTTFDFSNGY